jgi:hypothetical protein
VYYALGFGFLEHVYVASLTRELKDRGHDVRREISVPVLLGLLLHFGPQPKFYRVIASNYQTRDPNSPLPRVPPVSRVPRNPSVGVASGAERAPTSTSVSGAVAKSEPKC